MTVPDRAADLATLRDDRGYSEETCVRCGWRMGSPPLNCQNDNTPHRFPSQEAELAHLREERDRVARLAGAAEGALIIETERAEAAEARLSEAQDGLREAQSRCARLQQALDWYANEENYSYTLQDISRERNPRITDDNGHRAREALAGPDTPADHPYWSDVERVFGDTPADSQPEEAT